MPEQVKQCGTCNKGELMTGYSQNAKWMKEGLVRCLAPIPSSAGESLYSVPMEIDEGRNCPCYSPKEEGKKDA